MPEQINPLPLNQPVRQFTTPVASVGFFTERVDTSQPGYEVLERGQKYSSVVGADPVVVANFGELFFLKETINAAQYPFSIRLWQQDENAQDNYNSAVEYVSEAVNYPAYTRTYTIRRDVYDEEPSLTIGEPLTGVVAVKVVDGGQGYNADTTIIQFDDSLGSGAAATAVVDEDGRITNVIITNSGEGYTSPPPINVMGDGTLAQLTAIIQPQSAVLTSQKKTELNDDNPKANEFVLVTRIYETLPGPFICTTKIDDDGIVVTTCKRRNICADIVSGEAINTGVWTHTTKTAVDDFICEESVETRDLPGNPMVQKIFDKNGDEHIMTRTMKDASTITEQQTLIGTTWTSTTSKTISELVSWEMQDSMQVPGVQVPFSDIDETYGIVVNGFKQVVPATDVAEIDGSGFYVEIKPLDDLRAIKIASKVDTGSLPSPVTWHGAQYHAFPPELTDAEYNYAEAVCNCADSFSISLIANMAAFAGMVKARYTEQFYSGTPPDDVLVDQFFPVAHNFGFAWAWACGDSDGNCRVQSGAPNFHIPASLHGTINLTIGITTINTLAATTPTALPHGNYIMLAPRIERRPFNVFRRILVEVYVP